MDCYTCHGNGDLECPRCNGSGHSKKEHDKEACEDCQGSGNISCHRCSGNGLID